MAGARLPGLGSPVDPVPVPTERIPVDFAGDGRGRRRAGVGAARDLAVHDPAGELAAAGRLAAGGSRHRRSRRSPTSSPICTAGSRRCGPGCASTLRAGRIRSCSPPGPRTSTSSTPSRGGPRPPTSSPPTSRPTTSTCPTTCAPSGRSGWPWCARAARRPAWSWPCTTWRWTAAEPRSCCATSRCGPPSRGRAPAAGADRLADLAGGPRHSDRALRHFGDILRAMPTPTFPPSNDPRRPRYWSAEYYSPALRPALAALGERTGADPTRVLFAVYAIALAHVTGVHPALFRPVIGNRFRHQLADVVCHAAQAGMVLLDVADSTVEEVIERAGPAAMNAFKHSYFDPKQLNETGRGHRPRTRRRAGHRVLLQRPPRPDPRPGDPRRPGQSAHRRRLRRGPRREPLQLDPTPQRPRGTLVPARRRRPRRRHTPRRGRHPRHVPGADRAPGARGRGGRGQRGGAAWAAYREYPRTDVCRTPPPQPMAVIGSRGTSAARPDPRPAQRHIQHAPPDRMASGPGARSTGLRSCRSWCTPCR